MPRAPIAVCRSTRTMVNSSVAFVASYDDGMSLRGRARGDKKRNEAGSGEDERRNLECAHVPGSLVKSVHIREDGRVRAQPPAQHRRRWLKEQAQQARAHVRRPRRHQLQRRITWQDEAVRVRSNGPFSWHRSPIRTLAVASNQACSHANASVVNGPDTLADVVVYRSSSASSHSVAPNSCVTVLTGNCESVPTSAKAVRLCARRGTMHRQRRRAQRGSGADCAHGPACSQGAGTSVAAIQRAPATKRCHSTSASATCSCGIGCGSAASSAAMALHRQRIPRGEQG